MGKLASPSFEDEFAKVGRFPGLQLLFWESIKQRGPVGKEVLPSFDKKEALVNFARVGRGLWELADEPAIIELFGPPGDSQMSGGNTEAVEKGNRQIGKFEPHGESRKGTPFPSLLAAFLLIEKGL